METPVEQKKEGGKLMQARGANVEPAWQVSPAEDLFDLFSINTELSGSKTPPRRLHLPEGDRPQLGGGSGGAGGGGGGSSAAAGGGGSEAAPPSAAEDQSFAGLLPQGGTSSGSTSQGEVSLLGETSQAGTPILAVGADAGARPLVKVYDVQTQSLRFTIQAAPASFTGGIRVAVADVTGDGQDDIVTAQGPGGNNRVRVFDGNTGQALGGFSAFTQAQSDGVFVAAGDVNADGYADLIVGTEEGGAGLVRVFSGSNGALLGSITVDADAASGVRVAAGDVNGDGRADIITAAGPGGLPRVCVFDGGTGMEVYNFFAADLSYRAGLNVTAADLDNDGYSDIVVGSGAGSTAFVHAYSGSDTSHLLTRRFDPVLFAGGVRVAAVDGNSDGHLDIVAATGSGAGQVVVRDAAGAAVMYQWTPFGQGFDHGLFVAGSAGVAGGGGIGLLSSDPIIRVEATKSSLSEGGTAVGEFTLTLEGEGEFNFYCDLSGTAALDDPGVGDDDYEVSIVEGTGMVGSGGSLDLYLSTSSPTIRLEIEAIDDSLLENLETIVLSVMPAPGSYEVVYDGQPVVIIVDNDSLPPLPPPDPDCECGGSEQVAVAVGLPDNDQGKSAGGVRGYDGVVCLDSPDLATAGFGDWGQVRSWSNHPGLNSGESNGTGVANSQLPYLRQDSEGTTVATLSGNQALFFDGDGMGYTPRHHLKEQLSHDDMAERFTLKDTQGNQLVFFDFDTGLPAAKRGTLEKYIDAAGNETEVISFTTEGTPEEIQRQSTVGSTTVTESYLYSYVSSGTNQGKVASATLRRKVDSGSWETVRKVEYSYYDTSESYGNAGDLKLVVTKDASNNVLDTEYYRYYTTSSSTGYPGGLKYKFGMESYGRLAAAFMDPTTATDAQVDDYADLYMEYDGVQRVTKQAIQGAGCSSCTGGLGSYEYSYETSTFADGYNSWRSKQVTTLPDDNERIVYTNYAGQVILDVFKSGSSQWATFSKYDSNGRLVLKANPSAVSGYDETRPDLLYNDSGDYQYLRDDEGLIETYSYGTSTTASSSTAGDVLGYLKQTALQRGEDGTSILQSSVDYYSRTANSQTIYVTANQTVYRNSNGTGGQTTSTSYTWHSGTLEIESQTVTLPTVTTAQNGPNSADSMTLFMDTYGRVIWSKDGGGFLTYTEYDQATGAVVKMITDVDTTQTSDFANLPSGWSTPTGGGLHLITTYEVDSLGRATKETAPNGNVTYTVYNDDDHEVRVYRGWNTGTNTPTGPTEVYREDRAGSYSESLTMSATPSVTSGIPTGQESIGSLQTLSRTYTNSAGQVTHSDEYFNLSGLTYSTSTTLGTENTHFYRMTYSYDHRGRQNMVKSPTGTITRTVYDGLDRVVSTWVGTNDTGATHSDPTGGGATGNNMVKVSDNQYDDGGVGDSNLTKMTEYPGGSATARESRFYHDWRNRQVASKHGVQGTEGTDTQRPIFYTEYDNLGQAIIQEQYDGDNVSISDSNDDGVPDRPSSSLLRAKTVSSFDEQGRVYRTETYSVDPSNGNVSTSALTTDMWYDRRGNVIKTAEPGGLVTKTGFDGAGRTTTVYTTDGGGDSGYSDADDVTGDAVLEQVEYDYDDAGNVLVVTSRQRFHDETDTGALGTPSSGVNARVSYVGYYYDKANRLTDTVDVGTNGGSAWTRPGSVPSRSDTVLVTSQEYNAAGWIETITDPRGLVSKSYYDNLGRVSKTIEGYSDGTPSDDDDKTVEYTYDGAGHLLTLKALLTSGYQTTEWVYGVDTAGGSEIASNDILAAVKYPDKSTGDPSSSEQETYTVNALGEVKTKTDRNGSVHTYSYDVLGRQTADAVTTLGSGVDGAIRRIETAYDTAGLAYLFTSYDAASSGNVVNQVQREFNGLGQLIKEYQAVSGAVNTQSTPYVAYAYSEMASGANHSRLVTITYPNGKELDYNYASGLDSNISRLSSLSDSTGTLESYSYLGLSTVVVRAHPQPEVDLTYVKQGSESNGDAGDQYIGLDRFGRVVDQRWIDTNSSTETDRFQYGYDRDSNRLYRENLVDATFSELYQYDDLNQLVSFLRGELNSTKDGIEGTPTRSQEWDFDALGNFDSVTTDSVEQTRDHNAQNQITSIEDLTTPTYDSNGNTTGDEEGRDLIYDAWNRLVEVDEDSTPVAVYSHDALNRRVTEDTGTEQALYYTAGWQVIEERESGVAVVQMVFSPVYVDAIVLRDRDTDANGSLDERLWVQQDANWNVTAILAANGSIIERYLYDPYGDGSVLDEDWVGLTGSQYDWYYRYEGGRLSLATGHYHFRARDYSPSLGRWVQPDPIHFTSGDANVYRYLANSPGNFTDPLGLAPLVSPGELIKEGKIADLDSKYTTTPFKTVAAQARKVINMRFSYELKNYNYTLPATFNTVGLLTLKNKAIDEKAYKLPAGSHTGAFRLFFVRFDVCDPKGELGIRVTEYTNRIFGNEDRGIKGPIVDTPKQGNAWEMATRKMPNGKFDKSIIFGDSPGVMAVTKFVKKGQAGNDKDITPVDLKYTSIQFIEVINTKTKARLAAKLVMVKVNILKDGKVVSDFFSEKEPLYKKLYDEFNKQ